jgi:hypothetical protein
MRSPLCLVFALLAGLLVAAGCSSQQSYGTGQAWQRNECNKINDTQDRQRCMARANESHDSYQKQLDALKQPGRAE